MPFKDRKAAKEKYRALGICLSCVTRPAIESKTLCIVCRDKLKTINNLTKLKRAANQSKGLCGCGSILENEFKHCKKCNESSRKAKVSYKKKFPEKYKLIKKKQRKRRESSTKSIVLNYYSKGTMQCNCCSESHLKFLTIDHVNNDGAIQRKNNPETGKRFYKWLRSNNFPDGFQVLCYNCNLGRDKCDGKICPHKRSLILEYGAGI